MGWNMNTLFLVYLIVEAIFGIGFIFAPGFLLGFMGLITLDTDNLTIVLTPQIS